MILEYLTIFIILGFCSAAISYFIDFCFNEGNIFDWYYEWLVDKVQPYSEKIYKVLGGCNICFNTWVSIFIFILYLIFLDCKFIYFIPYISSSVLFSLYLNFKLKLF